MDRTPPTSNNEAIELYRRTYFSLLRSSGPVRIRSLEETHAAMDSNLHHHADTTNLDVSALVYAAMRMPDCVADTTMLVLGQMEDVFEREGYTIADWRAVKARARRRKYFFDDETATMAAFVSSVSDIDDLIPSLTVYQIEWNKLHQMLNNGSLRDRLLQHWETDLAKTQDLLERVRLALGLEPGDFVKLQQAWPGAALWSNLRKAVQTRKDMRVRVLGSGLGDYRRSVQYWWSKVEAMPGVNLWERPIYFVSSNTHSIINLISGTVADWQQPILDYVREENPEDLVSELDALPANDNGQLRNFLYYASRLYMAASNDRRELADEMARRETEAGVTRVSDPHCIDVEAQVMALKSLRQENVDPRIDVLTAEEWAALAESNAIIFNIDYPLGMAAYHVFSQLSTAVGRIMGVFILGKAATLNGRVGDVMIPNVVYDEHSKNTFLFRNSFTGQDVGPYLNYGTVLDNQKAVTVRGTILQNRDFMHVFYEEGYTDMEMEAGPYLSGIYEDVYPQRYPINEIVNLFINVPYEIGIIHYASDTPISRRQTLLSKSMSYFGVDATYATSVTVMRRILKLEASRLRKIREGYGSLVLPDRH